VSTLAHHQKRFLVPFVNAEPADNNYPLTPRPYETEKQASLKSQIEKQDISPHAQNYVPGDILWFLECCDFRFQFSFLIKRPQLSL